MLRLMLNAHSRIAVPHESGFIPVLYPRLHEYGDLAENGNASRLLADIAKSPHAARGRLVVDREAILAAPISSYADLIRSIFNVYAASKAKPRWGDKSPGYGKDLDVLWHLFPGCKIIHIVRDGRDVALSNRGVSWGVHSMARVAQQWRWETIVTRKLGSMIRENYMELRYEDLVQAPERELRRLCGHIGEDYDSAMLRYHESAASEVPAESLKWHRNSIAPPNSAKIGLWRQHLAKTDRIIFEEHAGDALEEFGYERERHPRTWRNRIQALAYAAWRR